MRQREIITMGNGVVSVPASGEIWMTCCQLADLFKCFAGKINADVRSILKSGVLDERTACRTYRYRNGGSVEEYGLEMIIALAFRIRSQNADLFREWLMKRAVAGTAPRTFVMVGGWSNRNIFPS